jgi:hypothetical protein
VRRHEKMGSRTNEVLGFGQRKDISSVVRRLGVVERGEKEREG